MGDVAIRVEELGKQYRIGGEQPGYQRYHTLREQIMRAMAVPWRALSRRDAPNGNQTIWALRDVSFEVKRGDVVGIIGRNGAGKSTLLKILSRITEPTTGEVDMYGRVGSLLEVGTGFNPELTGRENVYLNGAILGMRRAEIARKFDEIVAFAEVEKFIETPVKHYSSGMYMRLAFAVAAHLEPEILLIDEVLAVGDAKFQERCLGRMKELSCTGRTVLFVSHSMSTVLHLCTRAFFIHAGEVKSEGPTRQVVEEYLRVVSDKVNGFVDLSDHPARSPQSIPLIRAVRFLNEQEESTGMFGCGQLFTILIELNPVGRLDNPHLGIGFDNSLGQRLFSVMTSLSENVLAPLDKPTTIACELKHLPLVPGRYTLSLSAGSYENSLMDAIPNAVTIRVIPTNYFGNGHLPPPNLGHFLVKSSWSIRER
jgi:lipopolysaccharide transport system ATP-binding protein